MAEVHRYHLTLGPFPPGVRQVRFTFRCIHAGCDCRDVCYELREHMVRIE